MLFGAGASLDAAGPGLPPLTADLLHKLIDFAPSSWGGLSHADLQAFRTDFESAMAAVLARASGAGPPYRMSFPQQGDALLWSTLQWDMASYFHAFEVGATNLYERLLARLARARALARISLATLNYDRLLCLSAKRLGIQVQLGADLHPDRLRVCLPHGASFLASRADTANEASGLALSPGQGRSLELVGVGPVFQLNTPEIEVLGTPDQFAAKRIRSRAYPPIMSYIEPTKFAASGGSFLSRQRTIFRAWIAAADRLALIGIAVRSEDRHIWGPLGCATAKILYVAPSAPLFAEWSRIHGRDDPPPLPATWGDSFEQVCAFLSV